MSGMLTTSSSCQTIQHETTHDMRCCLPRKASDANVHECQAVVAEPPVHGSSHQTSTSRIASSSRACTTCACRAAAGCCTCGRPSARTWDSAPRVRSPWPTVESAVGSVRVRPETDTLYFDFRYRGVRCREFSTLAATRINEQRMQRVLREIEGEISAGTFSYRKYFPNSKRAAMFEAATTVVPPPSADELIAGAATAVKGPAAAGMPPFAAVGETPCSPPSPNSGTASARRRVVRGRHARPRPAAHRGRGGRAGRRGDRRARHRQRFLRRARHRAPAVRRRRRGQRHAEARAQRRRRRARVAHGHAGSGARQPAPPTDRTR